MGFEFKGAGHFSSMSFLLCTHGVKHWQLIGVPSRPVPSRPVQLKVTAAQQAFFIGSVINRILYTGVILAVVLVGGPDASVVRSLVRSDGKVLETQTSAEKV